MHYLAVQSRNEWGAVAQGVAIVAMWRVDGPGFAGGARNEGAEKGEVVRAGGGEAAAVRMAFGHGDGCEGGEDAADG